MRNSFQENAIDNKSTTSSKRDAFRNRLKMGGGIDKFVPMNMRNADERSSVSSRFVIKLQGTIEDDKIS